MSRTEGIACCGAPAVALLGAAAWSQPAASGTDLWWHLAAGREILSTSGLNIITADSMADAAKKAVQAADQEV